MSTQDPRGPEDRDDRLLQRLRDVANRADPVPETVRAAAVASFSWRTIDAELAALAYDSVLQEPVAAGLRGPTTLRTLTFETAALTIEVELGGDADDLRLLGQIAPARAAQIEVRQREGVRSATADALGRFAVDGLRRGPVQLRCRPEGAARAVATDWVAI